MSCFNPQHSLADIRAFAQNKDNKLRKVIYIDNCPICLVFTEENYVPSIEVCRQKAKILKEATESQANKFKLLTMGVDSFEDSLKKAIEF